MLFDEVNDGAQRDLFSFQNLRQVIKHSTPKSPLKDGLLHVKEPISAEKNTASHYSPYHNMSCEHLQPNPVHYLTQAAAPAEKAGMERSHSDLTGRCSSSQKPNLRLQIKTNIDDNYEILSVSSKSFEKGRFFQRTGGLPGTVAPTHNQAHSNSLIVEERQEEDAIGALLGNYDKDYSIFFEHIDKLKKSSELSTSRTRRSNNQESSGTKKKKTPQLNSTCSQRKRSKLEQIFAIRNIKSDKNSKNADFYFPVGSQDTRKSAHSHKEGLASFSRAIEKKHGFLRDEVPPIAVDSLVPADESGISL